MTSYMGLNPPRASRWALTAAFAAIYVVWGSTYLAVRFGLEGIPPMTLAAARSLLAGVLLYGWGRARGGAALTARAWRTSLVVGALMFLVGHGGMFWAIGRVPSGIVALLFATIPLWMALADAIGGGVLDRRAIVGLVGGLAGVSVLLGPGRLTGQPVTDAAGVAVVILAAMGWAAGSAIARRSPSSSVAVATGSYLLAGGVLLLVAGVVSGEVTRALARTVDAGSLLALAYLVLFGSVLTLGAYNWLLRRTSLLAVSTYAYVNPVVALLLGWLVAGESLGARVVTAACLILSSVALMLTPRDLVKSAA